MSGHPGAVYFEGKLYLVVLTQILRLPPNIFSFTFFSKDICVKAQRWKGKLSLF